VLLCPGFYIGFKLQHGNTQMRKFLSQKVANSAKVKAKAYQIHDTAIPGLVLRVQPTGAKIWKLIQDRKPRTLGRMPVMTFGMAKGKAEAILRGEDPDAVEDDQAALMTFDVFLTDYYQDWVEANHSQPNETMARLRRFYLGSKLLNEIKLADVETWRIKRQKNGISHATINRDIAAFKSSLQKAWDWDLLGNHPLARLKRLKVDKRRVVRYLTQDEEKCLFAALQARDTLMREARVSGNKHREERGYKLYPNLGTYADNLTPLVMLAINTGLRRGELWNLTWKDIDLRKKMLTVRGKGAKSGQTRHIPLNAAAVDVLKTHRGDVVPMPNVPVFGNAEFRKAFNALLDKAKIHNFRFHDTRHTFASKLVMAGVPLNTVRELMGHGSLEMTLIYAHLAPENLRDAVDMI
jgi:integrase